MLGLFFLFSFFLSSIGMVPAKSGVTVLRVLNPLKIKTKRYLIGCHDGSACVTTHAWRTKWGLVSLFLGLQNAPGTLLSDFCTERGYWVVQGDFYSLQRTVELLRYSHACLR